MLPYGVRASEQLDSFTRELDSKARVGYKEVGDKTREVLQSASWFDIETFGLRSTSPIYETSWAHGMNPAQSTLISPTSIGSAPGTNLTTPSKWTEAQLGRREAAVPGFNRALLDPMLPSQQSVGLSALNQASGRDVIIQNLQFESQFLAERLPGGELARWAKDANLELRSADLANNRLYETDARVNQLIADARRVGNSGQGLIDGKNLTQRYVDSWADLYTKGYSEAFFGETGRKARALGQTRVFDQLNITRSVFALAQQKGAMPLTGELNAGLSIEAFARANYGVGEFHGAAHDVHMQRDMFASTLNIGEKLKEGQELSKKEKDFLSRAAALQERSKVTSVKKRLTTAYLGLKELEGGLQEGALEGQLQRETKLSRPYARKHIVHTAEGEVRRATEGVTHRLRGQPIVGEGKPALEAMQDVLSAFKAEHAGAPSTIQLDHDAIYREVRSSVIDPFEARQAAAIREGVPLDRAIQTAYADDTVSAGRARVSQLNVDSLNKGIAGTAKDVITAHKGKIAIGAAAAYFLASISSSDDEYNVIEGLPESGLASQSRKYATEFGSGYQGPNPWINPEYNRAQDIERYKLGRASSMGKSYAEHVKSFTSKDEVPEWVTATASAGSVLHRIEAAKKLASGEISQAEEFVYDPVARVSGHMDLTLEGGIPADIKTVSEGRLRQVERKGAFKKHISQLNFYMHTKGADRGYLEYVSREDQSRRKKVWIAHDEELLRRDVKRMESARSTVRRGVALGIHDSETIQRGADLKRLTAAAQKDKGETARDSGYFQMRYLENVFQEEMEYLRDAKRRAGHKVRGPSRFSGRDDSYNTIEAFKHQGLMAGTRKLFDFGSGWTGLAASLRSFATKYPKTTATIGVGAAGNIAFGGGSESDEEEGSFLGGMAVGAAKIAGTIALAGAIPGLAMAAQAGLVAKTAGGSGLKAFAQSAPHTVVAGYKAQAEILKSYVGIHTGASGKALLEEAAEAGVDLSLKAQLKRGVEGPAKLAGEAAEHTAKWLEKNWAPAAESLKDPAAVGLGLLTGYEAVGIARDAVDLDVWGVAKGALLFAGAKYAYMGWHHRSAIAKVWKESNYLDKTVAAYTGLGALSNLPQIAIEGAHAAFAYGRYGAKPKDFYKKVGVDLGSKMPKMEEIFLEGAVKATAGMDPEVARKVAGSFDQIADSASRDVKRLAGLSKEEFADSLETLGSGLRKFDEQARETLKETGSFKFIDRNKESILARKAEEKAGSADVDALFEAYQKNVNKVKEKSASIDPERSARVKEHLETLKARAGVKEARGHSTTGQTFSGTDDAYNTIHGFQDKGVGKAQRSDFGSGYVIDRKTIPAAMGRKKDRHLKTRMGILHRAGINSVMTSMHRRNINRSYRG